MPKNVTIRATLLALCCTLPIAAHALADAPKQVNIPAGDLSQALLQLSKQYGADLVYRPEQVHGLKTRGAHGELTTEQAVTRLLEGTRLQLRTDSSGAMLIIPQSARTSDSGAVRALDKSEAERDGVTADDPKPSFWSRLQLAQADKAAVSTSPPLDSRSTAAAGAASAGAHDAIAEVVVTAQKRTESLMSVPTSINVLSGEQLQALQLNSLSDLASYVPGLTVIAGGAPGYRNLVIRGINASSYNNTTGPLVATYIDDLAVGSSSLFARGAQYGVDLAPYDISRVEALKGPQGTLYGANAMGGLVKYVLNRPDLTTPAAKVGADVSYINSSNSPTWGVRGMVNVPIVSDALGLQVTAFDKRSAGFIDNIGLGVDGSNNWTEYGGLATLLWQANERLNVRATALTQHISQPDMTGVTLDGATRQPQYGWLKLRTLFPERYQQSLQNYSLTVDWDVGFATLTSASGYSEMKNTTQQDLTDPYGSYVALVDPTHADALANWVLRDDLSKFVEEVRLTSPSEQRLQWLVGGYYTREVGDNHETIPTYTPAYTPLPAADNVLIDGGRGVYRETAGFANLTYRLTERFDFSGGVRYSAYSQSECPDDSLGIFGSGPAPCSALPATDVWLWMTNARLHLNEDQMLYARIATGYRPGSGCPTCGNAVIGVPEIVEPDKTINYELGFKGQWFGRRLQVEAAAFYIDWTNIQLALETPNGFGYPGNGGDAVSKGFELTSTWAVTDQLRLNATLAYTDAHMTEVSPAAKGASVGDPLPDAPRWTASVIADYSLPLDGGRTFLAGGSYRYRDWMVNNLGTIGIPTPPLGPQNLIDVYTGLVIKNLTLRLTATNIFNNESYTGILYISDPAAPRLVPTQPRTIGLSADLKF